MKNSLLLTFLLICSSLTCDAQMAGSWSGKIQVTPAYALTMVLHVAEQDNTLTATMDSPDQGTTGIEVSSISFDQSTNKLQFESKAIGAKYQGTLTNDTIRGFYIQGGMPLKLHFTRGDGQQPDLALPYNSEEVTITSDDVSLSGTITSPIECGKPVAVLLIAGSGPNNRNSQFMQHKPLFYLADHLTQEGYTVLRYDKRGTGNSTGIFMASTITDFMEDALSALRYLRGTGKYSKIGIVGHSEGGLIAQMIAATYPKSTDFIVLLAAPGVSGIKTIVYQNEVMMAHLLALDTKEEFRQITEDLFTHIAYDDLDRSGDSLLMRNYLERVFSLVQDDLREQAEQIVGSEKYFTYNLNALTPYYKGFLRTAPDKYLPHITCPILAINGDKDMQVEADANLKAIKELANKQAIVTTIKVQGLNHLFLPSQTGMAQEYMYLQPGFSPTVLKYITDWLPTE